MRTYSLDEHQSIVLGVVLVAAALVVRRASSPKWRRLAPIASEIGLLLLLDALWIIAGSKSLVSNATASRLAVRHSHRILDIEHWLHLPDERSLIDFVAGRPLLAQASNLYYALMHFTVMGIFLVWLFLRHRDRYYDIRTTMAGFTALALLVQLIPVAPPRLLTGDGFIDVAARYGQSVYVAFGSWNVAQLSAMPSVHVGWAVLVGWAVWTLGTGRWRWLGPAHSVVTILVVVGTANHFWADGIVAVALLIAMRYGQLGVVLAWRRCASAIASNGARTLTSLSK